MKKKKWISVLLVLALSMTFIGCASGGETPGNGDGTFRVAMILSGFVNDAGWNESAYNGLLLAESDLNVEVAYSENVQQADFESTMRDYASQGYDMIIAVGNEFSDAALVVAPSYPDVLFGVMNGNQYLEPNLAAYRFNTPETGFTAGVLAALYSESGVVGMVGGTTLPHIQDAVDAFGDGARYVNPDIQVLTGFTESMTDIALGFEMGMAFIDQGADVLSANANTTALGVIDAAKTAGIRHIGYVSDQYEVAPDTIMVSMIQSNQLLILAMVRSGLDGTFTPSLNLFGMNEGAINISDFHGHDDKLPEGGMDTIDEVLAGIMDGSLKDAGVLPKSVFEVE